MTSFMDQNGLSIKRQNDILNEMLSGAQTAFSEIGEPIDASPSSLLGNFLNVFSSEIADVWLGVQEVYDAFNPSTNEGKNLVDSCALSAITKLEASNTKVMETLVGDIGTKIPSGYIIKCSTNNELFSCNEEVTIGESGKIDLLFTAQNVGAIICPPNTLTIIPTPLQGLKTVTNSSQPISLGRLLESDAELRIRRAKSGPIIGQNVNLSLQAKLLDIIGVSTAQVIENCSLEVSPEGIPPKSFESIIEGGDDNEIANTIWQNKPSGISTYGNVCIQVQISTGQLQSIYFSRPIDVPIKVSIFYSINPDELFPQNGEDLIRSSIVQYGNALGINKDVIDQRFFGSIFSSCPGILNLNIQVARKSDGKFSSEVAIGKTEYSSFDPNDIVVTKHV